MSAEDFAWAVRTGDLAGVRDFINNKTFAVNYVEPGINQRTPLHWAADYGKVEVIDFLISKGADVEAKDRYGNTPLFSAIYEGHDAAVAALIAKGANKNAIGQNGKKPIEVAEKDSIKALLR
eukprot:CAMPEP_0184659418 /NCGR_PEP_ID=MMETSP0308-20130426/29517_1 /TAXON_ID=38269 /ORGANISM="Gloeochaete witrockiana, Strain SAG 46.84" /LENGTH=121 /DNA_ID=CAMNT_0027099213 /DNA_START=9 /DNA_END=374 /DNA_ORIENTATION=+